MDRRAWINRSGSTWRSRCSEKQSCYTTPGEIQDAGNLQELGRFCRRMGREAHQGEIGLVVGDAYFAIRDFAEEHP